MNFICIKQLMIFQLVQLRPDYPFYWKGLQYCQNGFYEFIRTNLIHLTIVFKVHLEFETF